MKLIAYVSIKALPNKRIVEAKNIWISSANTMWMVENEIKSFERKRGFLLKYYAFTYTLQQDAKDTGIKQLDSFINDIKSWMWVSLEKEGLKGLTGLKKRKTILNYIEGEKHHFFLKQPLHFEMERREIACDRHNALHLTLYSVITNNTTHLKILSSNNYAMKDLKYFLEREEKSLRGKATVILQCKIPFGSGKFGRNLFTHFKENVKSYTKKIANIKVDNLKLTLPLSHDEIIDYIKGHKILSANYLYSNYWICLEAKELNPR